MKERLEEAEVLYEDERERVVAETRAARRNLAYKLRQARAEETAGAGEGNSRVLWCLGVARIHIGRLQGAAVRDG